MSKLRLFLLAVLYSALVSALESAARSIGVPAGLVPDLVLLFVLFVSFYEISPYGALIVFIAGLMVDLSGGMLLGPWAGAYVLCFGGLALVSDRIFVESWVSLYSITVVFVAISHFLFLLIAFDPLGQLATEWPRLVGKAFVTALCAPPVFAFFRWILAWSKGDVGKVQPHRF